MKSLYKVIGLIITVIFMFTFALSTAAVDSNQKGTIEINYTYESMPLDFVTFKVYQVANLKADRTYELSTGFEEVDLDFYQLGIESYWINIKGEINHHISYKNLAPTYQFKTNDAGNYKLEDIDLGLYYVKAESSKDVDCSFCSEPFLIFVGKFDNHSNKWVYEFKVQPKVEMTNIEDQKTIVVNKTWRNVDSSLLKPKSIEVQLLCNGIVYDTVILNDKNLWSYTWTNLDLTQTWAVIEKTQLKDFKVSYDNDEYDFEIINTYIGEKEDEIPKTGSTIYLVPVLSAVGIIMIMVGIIVKMRISDDE